MENSEDRKGRVEDQNGPKEEDKYLSRRIISNKAENTVESEDNGHQRAYIFPDHLYLLILSIDIPNPHVIEGPEGREKQRDDHCDSADNQHTAHLKLSPGEEKEWLFGYPSDDLKGCK